MIKNTNNVEHYRWGNNCDGWILSDGSDLLVIEERMPPQTAEQRHYHTKSKQVFYVLSGTLTMELDNMLHRITARNSIEIQPNLPHQARNESDQDVMFLVISSPTSRGDRLSAEI